MTDTIREGIIQAIVTNLEGGTYTILDDAVVYRGRQLFDPDTEELPLITVLPRLEDAERTQYGTSLCRMPIDISCLVRIDGRNVSTLAESALGELIKSAMSSLPSDADDVTYTGGGVEQYPDVMGQKVLMVGITIRVEYQFNSGDPYN